MQLIIEIIPLILLFGAFQGFFLTIALFTIKSNNQLSNRILASILLLFSTIILLHTIVHAGHTFNIPLLSKFKPSLHFFFEPLYIFYGMAFLFGPLFFFYTKALTHTNFHLKKEHALHFLPAFICLSTIILFFVLYGSKDNLNFLLGWLSWLVFIHAFSYIIMVITMLHRLMNSDSFSPVTTSFKWLKFFVICFIFIWVVSTIMHLYGSDIKSWNYIWLLTSLFIYTTGYMGLKRPQIFTTMTGSIPTKGLKKYERSSLTEEKAKLNLEKLLRLMHNDKPYLQHDLTLPMLAKMMSIPHHHLSQIINENLDKNFFEFINSHRVKAAKIEMLDKSKKHLNLSAIAMSVGFSSISAFNTAFKKFSHMTPTQFLESRQGDM